MAAAERPGSRRRPSWLSHVTRPASRAGRPSAPRSGSGIAAPTTFSSHLLTFGAFWSVRDCCTRPAGCPAAVARLALAEARVYATCAAACATARPITLRQLAALTGPTGHPIDLRNALEAIRDLADTGLLHLPSLTLNTPDSPRRIHVHVPGCAAQTATVPAPATRTYAVPPLPGASGGSTSPPRSPRTSGPA